MKYSGTWHIYEMEAWDEDYFNMEVEAYITINSRGSGDLQFGLVSGELNGAIERIGAEECFHFTWDGTDDYDPISGAGWFTLTDADHIQGRIVFHMGDRSDFLAKRATRSCNTRGEP